MSTKCKATKKLILSSAPAPSSVSEPNAQTTTLCGLGLEDDYMKYIETLIHKAATYHSIELAVLTDLLFTNGLRVSEALSIRSTDIASNGMVKVRGLKGSKDRICYTTHMSRELVALRSTGGLIFGNLSRFYVYREFKKLGISFSVPGMDKKSVTHAPRHLFVLQAKASGWDTADTQAAIGHNSIQSTEYYERH